MKKLFLTLCLILFSANQLNASHWGACICGNEINPCRKPILLETSEMYSLFNMEHSSSNCPIKCQSNQNWFTWTYNYDDFDFIPACQSDEEKTEE